MKQFLFTILNFCLALCAYPQYVENLPIVTGTEQLEKYIPLLKNKKVGFMGNQTSLVGKRHIVDILLENGVDLKFVFAPEHGFRGNIERGKKVFDYVDEKTGLPIYSLYGENEKTDSIVASVDVVIFDIQDVGARFYTYISSLHRLMQLCTNANVDLIVLDRPNPNGDQVDGPVLKDDKFKSIVGFHKIAMIHGLTVGELAQMINGEGWLDSAKQCRLTVIPVKNYTHKCKYELPVAPSPSLPNYLSVRLYPSLCLFEGTDISVGRGTDFPFQQIGYPDSIFGSYTFIPEQRTGMIEHVENKGEKCYGINLKNENPDTVKFTLKYILEFYKKSKQISAFNFFSRPDFFNKLAGNAELQEQIKAGLGETEIRASWTNDLNRYKIMRKKYLLYPDFE